VAVALPSDSRNRADPGQDGGGGRKEPILVRRALAGDARRGAGEERGQERADSLAGDEQMTETNRGPVIRASETDMRAASVAP
jgi:hypothetical protein